MKRTDKTTFTLTCQACGRRESGTVVDKGRGNPAPNWGRPPRFADFTATWSGQGGEEAPRIVEAGCVACGVPAKVAVR